MVDNRPKRSRKQVDYAKYASAFSEDEDDDFESFTPPVSKKAKLETNKRTEKRERTNIQTNHSEPSTSKQNKSPVKTVRRHLTSRKTPDERAFERELELALEVSKQRSSQTQELDAPPTLDDLTTQDEKACTKEDVPTYSVPPVIECYPVENSPTKSADESSEYDRIHEGKNGPKHPSNRPKVSSDEGSDYNDTSDGPSSELEFDPDEDGDFDEGKKQKKIAKIGAKKAPSKNPSKKTAPPTKAPKTVSRVQDCSISLERKLSAQVTPRGKDNFVKPAEKTEKSFPTSTPRSPLTSLQARQMGSPSVASLGGVNLKSPSSGVLRLGLSRHSRVKPLHANVKQPH